MYGNLFLGHFKKMCFRASPFLVLKVVGGVVGVVLGCAHRARRVSSLRFSAIFASGRCIWCYSILQGGIRRQEQKTKLKNSLIQPRTSQKKFSLFENVSYFVFIVWRSTDPQFFYSPSVEITQTSRINLAKNCKISRNAARPAHKKLR